MLTLRAAETTVNVRFGSARHRDGVFSASRSPPSSVDYSTWSRPIFRAASHGMREVCRSAEPVFDILGTALSSPKDRTHRSRERDFPSTPAHHYYRLAVRRITAPRELRVEKFLYTRHRRL